MRKKVKIYHFTLAEILVAMAVFSILLVLMLQFFSGARTLWIANEKRAAVYADASIALDLMANLLQTTYLNKKESVAPNPPENQTVFLIKHAAPTPANSGANDMIFFNSELPGGDLLSGGAIRFLSLQRGDDPDNDSAKNNVLYLKVFSDEEGITFSSCSDLAGLDSGDDRFSQGGHDGTLLKVRDYIQKLMTTHDQFKLKKDSGSSDDQKRRVKPILRNVSGLRFIPIYFDENESKIVKDTGSADFTGIYTVADKKTFIGVEIELSLMPSESVVTDWATKSFNADFRTTNEYTFRRTVWFGQRMYIK